MLSQPDMIISIDLNCFCPCWRLAWLTLLFWISAAQKECFAPFPENVCVLDVMCAHFVFCCCSDRRAWAIHVGQVAIGLQTCAVHGKRCPTSSTSQCLPWQHVASRPHWRSMRKQLAACSKALRRDCEARPMQTPSPLRP